MDKIKIDEDLVISFFKEISRITDQYTGNSLLLIKRLQTDLNYIITKYQSKNRIFDYLSIKVNTKTVLDEYTDITIILSIITPGQIFSNNIYEFFKNFLQTYKLLIPITIKKEIDE